MGAGWIQEAHRRYRQERRRSYARHGTPFDMVGDVVSGPRGVPARRFSLLHNDGV